MKKNRVGNHTGPYGKYSYVFGGVNGLLCDKNGLYEYEEDTMNRGRSRKPNYSCVTGGGSRNYIPYSDEALKYFERTNDDTEFTTEFIGNYDYMSYLLGDEMDVSGSFESDVMEYDEMNESDDYLD